MAQPARTDQTQAASDAELLRGIEKLYALQTAAHSQLLAFIGEMDSRGTDRSATAVGIGAHLGISIATAKRWVETARLLRSLPHLAALYDTGTVSYEKLEAVAKIATPETDAELAETAATMTVGALRRLAAKLQKANDPHPAHRARHLNYAWREGGTVFRFSGQLTGDAGDVFAKAIEREMDTMPQPPTGEFVSYSQKAADALVNLASTRIADDQDPDRATVVVHTDLSLLTGGEGVAESEFGTILHPDTARRLLCDSRIQVAVHDQDGKALNLGRTQRTVPPWMLRQLKERDKCCTFPGCSNRRFMEAHHINEWARDGGETNLDEVTLPCSAHHRLVHEGGWRIEMVDPATGETNWYRPDGTLYTGGPPPLDEATRARFFGPLVPESVSPTSATEVRAPARTQRPRTGTGRRGPRPGRTRSSPRVLA